MFTIAFSTTLLGLMPAAWPTVLRASVAAVVIALLIAGTVRLWPAFAALPMGLPGWWGRYDCRALFFIAFCARVLLILVIPVEPVSDYILYYDTAKALLNGSIPPWEPYIIVIAPNVWAFAAALSGWMRAFGTALLSAQLFVALCFSWTTVLFYRVARQLVSPLPATVAALWIAVSPETLLYTLHVGNEATAMLLLMLGLWCLLKCLTPCGKAASALYILAGGLSLAACQALRPVAALVWLPMGLFCCFPAHRQSRLGFVKLSIAFFLFAGGCVLLNALRAQAFGVSAPPSLGWALYEGLDLAGKGQWTPEKNAVMERLLRELPAVQVQPAFLRLAWERVCAYAPYQWLGLFAVKLSSLWSDCGYLFVASASSHPFSVALATACLWAQGLLLDASFFIRQRERYGNALLLCLFPIGLLSAFCLFGTAINRYHFVVLPFLALALSVQWERIRDNSLSRYQLIT